VQVQHEEVEAVATSQFQYALAIMSGLGGVVMPFQEVAYQLELQAIVLSD